MVTLGLPRTRPNRTNLETLLTLYQAIGDHPGLNRIELARLLGWRWETVNSRIDSLERAELLVSEDYRERLYPFPGAQEADE